MKLTLEDAEQKFAHWRAYKQSVREPIPNELWIIAVSLIEDYSQGQVAKILRLNTATLSQKRKDLMIEELSV